MPTTLPTITDWLQEEAANSVGTFGIPQQVAINDSGQIVGSDGTQGFLATPVPEPVSLLLVAAGLVSVGLLARRTRIA